VIILTRLIHSSISYFIIINIYEIIDKIQLRYRIIRYEFSIETSTSLMANSLNLINSHSSPSLILNIETKNQFSNQVILKNSKLHNL
jgi:hypothetical protein